MKYRIFLPFLLIFIISATSAAQSIQFGIRAEKNSVTLSKDMTNSSETPFSGIGFSFNYLIYDKFAIDLRYAGELDSDFYKGDEYGMLGRYYYKDIYAAAGIIIHTIGPNGHGFSSESISQKVMLPAIGAAYNPEGLLNRHLVFEILFINGMNKTVGWSSYSAQNEDIKLEYVIKIGMGYSFNF